MPITSSGSFTYVRKQSAWQTNQAWRSRIRSQVQSYLNDAQTIQSALTTARDNQISGMATLAAQAAASRVQAAGTALQSSAKSVNLTA